MNNIMIMFWKPTRLKTKNLLGYNDVLKVWPHLIENNQAGTIVLKESPTTNFRNAPWHIRFSQHGRKPTTCLEMMMFRKFSQFDWKWAGSNVFEELPTASTSEMHHKVSKLANMGGSQQCSRRWWRFENLANLIDDPRTQNFSAAIGWLDHKKQNICIWWHSEGFGIFPPPTLEMCIPIKCHGVRGWWEI